ncbi:Ribonuclease R [Streptococcus parauberis]|nr:Ribonuclease R [Streptococcus parauberis]
MAKVEGQPGAEVLNMMLLRSMQQARYSETNHGHYGLAAEYYTHFTSPIRRYPDLLVHRMIRDYSHVTEEKKEHFAQVIPELAASSSRLERRAIDAERLVEAMKKAEYMEEHVGEEFDAIVASVVKFGMFIELPNTIEGLIHVTSLPEFYNYNERNMTLQGEKSGIVFKVGQPIHVKLVKANKETGDIDFEYLPSEFDVKEKVEKPDRQNNRRRNNDSKKGDRFPKNKSNDQNKEEAPKKKGRKPFYKDAAKKNSKKRSR